MRKQLKRRCPIRLPIRLHNSLKNLQMLLPATTIKSGNRRICKTALRFDDVLPIGTSRLRRSATLLHNRTPVRSISFVYQSWSWTPIVTCRGFGRASDDYNKTQLRFNNRVYLNSLSHGEHLLRCGIYTSTDIFTSLYDHTKWYTCGKHLLRCGIDTSTYIVFIIIIYICTTVQIVSPGQPHIRATAQPHNRATCEVCRTDPLLSEITNTEHSHVLIHDL